MATFQKPTTITQAFANGDGNIYIPGNTSNDDYVNQVDGFPINQENQIEEGGVPVSRHQMNGAFNLLSQHILWGQVGGTYTFDPIVADAGGYNKGAVLNRFDAGGNVIDTLYSTKDNNTDNFILNPSFIGTSWQRISTINFPDIINDVNTGNVVIGDRLNGSINALITRDNPSVAYIKTIPKDSSQGLRVEQFIFNPSNNTSILERTMLDNNSAYPEKSLAIDAPGNINYLYKLYYDQNHNNYSKTEKITYNNGNSILKNSFNTNTLDRDEVLHLNSDASINTGYVLDYNNRLTLINSIFFPPVGENVITANDLNASKVDSNIYQYQEGTATVIKKIPSKINNSNTILIEQDGNANVSFDGSGRGILYFPQIIPTEVLSIQCTAYNDGSMNPVIINVGSNNNSSANLYANFQSGIRVFYKIVGY